MLAVFPVCAQEKPEIPDISIKNGDIDFSAIKDSPAIELISSPLEAKMPNPDADGDTAIIGKAIMRYIRIYTYFNLKYPGNKINDDLLPDLQKLFPKEKWGALHLQFIYYGRTFCKAHTCKTPETMCEICAAINSKK